MQGVHPYHSIDITPAILIDILTTQVASCYPDGI